MARGTTVFRIRVELISALKSHHRGRSGLSRPSVGGAHAAIRPSPTLGNLPNTFSLRARSTISRRHGSPAHYEGFTRGLWPVVIWLRTCMLAGFGWGLQAARLRRRPEGSPRYRRWRPFFLISRAIVDRSQLLALTPEDAEDAAAVRLCHADEKLRLIRTIIINICGDRRQEAAHIPLRSDGVSVSRSITTRR